MDEEKFSCTKCNLYKSTSNPYIKSTIPKDVVVELAFVAEAPGQRETELGEPLVGPAGENLNEALRLTGISRSTVMLGNCVICRPIGNRTPTPKEMASCSPYIISELKTIKPKVIVTLGLTATKAILKDENIRMGDAHGRTYQGKEILGYNCYIVPTWHPSPTTFMHYPHRKQEMITDIRLAKSLLQEELLEKVKDWQYLIVSDYNGWQSVKPLLDVENKPLTVDIETTSLDFLDPDAKITNIGLSTEPNFGISILVDQKGNWTPQTFDLFIKELKEIYERLPLIGHHIRFDTKFLKAHLNLIPRKFYWDTSYIHSMLQPGDSVRLKDIAHQYTDMGGYEHNLARYGGLKNADSMQRAQYNIDDVVCTSRVAAAQIQQVKFNKQEFLAFNIIMPAAEILFDMEYDGVKIDQFALNQLDLNYRKQIADTENAIQLHPTVRQFRLHCGHFNPNSPAQIAKLLFDSKYCNLTPIKFTEKKQIPAADKEVLETYAEQSEICKLLLQSKKFGKLHSTYIIGMKEKIVEDRIHTTYNQDITRSGRLSSNTPNLMNISRGSDIKSMFIPDYEQDFIDADYKQMELIVSTYYTHDKVMMDASQSGDIHTYLAKLIFGFKDISEEQRTFLKTLNFGVFYGMGKEKLAGQLKITSDEASSLITEYFNLLPATKIWVDLQRKLAKTKGCVSSLLGRTRYYNTEDPNETFNSAVNHPIQSLASDLVLYGMILWKRYLVERNLYRNGVWFSLQVHDSITSRCYHNLTQEMLLAKKQVLESVKFPFMTLPLTVEMKVGSNWGAMQKICI